MKRNKNLVTLIGICFVLIVISSIYLYKIVNDVNSYVQDFSIDNNDLVNDPTYEFEIVDDNPLFKDLRDNLGKGTNGDVNKIEQSTNELGEKEYIYHYTDGSTQTVTVKHIENLSDEEYQNIVEQQIQNNDDNDPSNNDQDDAESEDITQQEPEFVAPEATGTVYERYLNMSSREQYSFYKSFKDRDEFMKWHDAAQAEYYELHPNIEISKNDVLDVSKN